MSSPSKRSPNRPKLLLLLTLICLVDPNQAYTSHSVNPNCPSLPFDDRIRVDCYPERDASRSKCLARGCCWRPGQSAQPNVPYCFFPNQFEPTYKLDKIKWNDSGFNASLTKLVKTKDGSKTVAVNQDEFAQVNLEARFETSSRLRLRVTIPSQPGRWEPPIPLDQPTDRPTVDQVDYLVNVTESPFGIKVSRRDDPTDVLLDTGGQLASAFIIADQFLQLAFKLNVQRVYGPGEARVDFPNDLSSWSRVGLWARDQPPVDAANLYGVHNLLIGLNYKGQAFGLFLLNSNAQEIAFSPLPSVTYRTIGGILDFFLFTGPTPQDVVAQYTQLIGRPPIPPYWSLGFHLCRYGYKNLDDISATLERNLLAGMPIDVQWADIDYMDAVKVWTIDEKLFGDIGNFTAHRLHKELGIRFVPILDPGISISSKTDYQPYTEGLRAGLFINYSSINKPLIGKVWPGETVFPDFSHPAAEDWWYRQAKQFQSRLAFDGLWIDMNEPSSFIDGSIQGCPASKFNNPPFVPLITDRTLWAKTICPTARHHDTMHYNRHNLYAYDEARVTFNVLKRLFPNQRSFILSRSTFAGSGRYTSHWTGDNLASWSDLKASVKQILTFNMVGIPLVGADICGFRGEPTEELCIRWFQLGAFYPFSRSHNAIGLKPQDPAAWSEKAIKIIKNSLGWRYRLLPYFYTQFFKANLDGLPVVRPLSFDFPTDYSTHSLNEQFMFGPSLLVNPVLSEYQRHVDAYLPPGEWIDMHDSSRIISSGQFFHLDAPLSTIPVLGRAGSILPVQYNLERTSVSRQQGLVLYVLLSSVDSGFGAQDNQIEAAGELYWDDGQSQPVNYLHVVFKVANRSLMTSPKLSHPEKTPHFGESECKVRFIALFGISTEPISVILNHETRLEINFLRQHEMVVLKFESPLDLMQPNIIEWYFD